MGGGQSITYDTLLELCQNHQRRIVLAVLAAERRTLTLNDLTKTILKHNHHTPLTDVSEETATQIQTALHHVHVPKLLEVGVVIYDTERQLVTPTARFEQLQPRLSTIIDADPELTVPLEL